MVDFSAEEIDRNTEDAADDASPVDPATVATVLSESYDVDDEATLRLVDCPCMPELDAAIAWNPAPCWTEDPDVPVADSGSFTDDGRELLEAMFWTEADVSVGMTDTSVRDTMVFCSEEAGVAVVEENVSVEVIVGMAREAMELRVMGGSKRPRMSREHEAQRGSILCKTSGGTTKIGL